MLRGRGIRSTSGVVALAMSSLIASSLIACSSGRRDEPTIGEADAALKKDVSALLKMLALPLGEVRVGDDQIDDCRKGRRRATYSVSAPITGPIGTERSVELLTMGAFTELGYEASNSPNSARVVVVGDFDARDTSITLDIDYIEPPPSKVEVTGITACLPSR